MDKTLLASILLAWLSWTTAIKAGMGLVDSRQHGRSIVPSVLMALASLAMLGLLIYLNVTAG